MVSECLYFHGVKEPRRVLPSHPTGGRETDSSSAIEGVDTFFHELFHLVGLSPDSYRSRALNRRVPACLRFLRVNDLRDARAKLKARPELAPATVSVVLLGVTDFCRDETVFAHLRSLVVPGLACLGRPLRVWSAACSDGRELCSVAILLNEAGLLDESDLLGTDCREDAIRQAQAGEFPTESINNLGSFWKQHFSHYRGNVRPTARLHQSLRWKQANLLQQAEPGPWDLILWRNMAIYLEVNAAETIWHSLIRELAPGGFLVSGKAEHPPGGVALEKLGPCIFRKPA